MWARFGSTDFPTNLKLAWAVGRHLGIADEVISRGIRDATADPGAVRVWEYRSEEAAKACYMVNSFAANDPQSTLQVITHVRKALPSCPDRVAGLLALRPDRGDRTVQWIDAIGSGDLDCFDQLYVVGGHAHAMKRKLPGLRVLREDQPDQIMATIMADIGDGDVLFGCGNYVGTGQLLVDHWERTGTRHGL
jgi:UDP-N-acetylmuramyl pentapeptide synthase